jgi:RND family efflux transporter MFP subunit
MLFMDRHLGWIIVLGLTGITLGCNRESGVTPPSPLEVVVSKPITNEQIADWDVYTGKVEAKESVPILARVRGEIKQILFEEGTEIEANKLLFVIDDAPFQADLLQAKGTLVTWEAKLEAAEKKLKIYEPLEKAGTVSKDELIQAYSAKGEAIGNKETAKGKILEAETNIKYCKIVSPLAGKIGEPALKVGAIVNSGGADNVLTNIVSVNPMYVYFYVTERAMLNYQKNMLQHAAKDKKTGKLIVPVHMALLNEADFPHKGVVDFADIKVDSSTGTYKVRAVFPNPKGADDNRPLTPGLFARVRVGVSEPYTPIQIANRAILSDQSLKYVLILGKNNVVQRVDIEPSSRLQDTGLVAVDAGLKGDELIIVEGINRVRPGMTVAVKGDPVPMPKRPVPKS